MPTSLTDHPVIHARGFSKRYGQRTAVSGLDLDIGRGEIFGLIGPDGAGKSSLIKAAAGVLSFEAGALEVFGVSLDSEAACERIKSRIGLMPQGLGQNLYADLSIEENIDFFARLRLVPDADLQRRKEELLQVTRLDKFRDRAMKQLSGGMKQKLGLVCTLIHEPELILLDEPTTGVDPVSRRDFWAILGRLLRERGITALVSTAYMDEASTFARVGLMFGGQMLAAGRPDDIRNLAPGLIADLDSSAAAADLALLRPQFPQSDTLGERVRVYIDETNPDTARQALATILGAARAAGARFAAPELEDTFIALLRQRQLAQLPRQFDAHSDGNHRRGDGEAIVAEELTRDFGAFRAADRVSFTIRQGEIFGLLGANGAGKSTVIKMLTGILRPSSGRGHVAGADMRTAGSAIKERIGYMSQAFSLYLDLTVVENIRLYGGIYGLSGARMRERLAWVLDSAELQGYEHERAARLPMGLRQRLALGCALIHEPRVLFLDEPTSGVDPIGRRAFWDMLYRLARIEHVAILITTHYMMEAEHCDRIALMYAGRVVAAGSPAAMKAEVEQEFGSLLQIDCAEPQRAHALLRAQNDARLSAQLSMYGLHLQLLSTQADTDRERIAALLQNAGIGDVQIARQPLSMESVFVQRVTALEAADRAKADAAKNASRHAA